MLPVPAAFPTGCPLRPCARGLAFRGRAEALVFDYVGMRPDTLDEVVHRLDRPVFELGRLALGALQETLAVRGGT